MMKDTNLLLPKMKIKEGARAHPCLDPRKVIEIFVEQITAVANSVEGVLIRSRKEELLRPWNIDVRRIHQAVEVEVHLVGIGRMRAMPEDPGKERVRIEGHVRKDGVVKIIAEL